DSRKQLHAVRRQFGGILDRQHNGQRGERPSSHSGPSHAFLDINGMDTPACSTWRFSGDSDEETDDKHRATSFPQRTGGRRDPAFALRQRGGVLKKGKKPWLSWCF